MLFIDEVHRFNKAQQDVLLPAVEDGLVVLIGATTENPFFEVNAPLMSRSTLWRLEPLSDEELTVILRRGLEAEGATADDEAIEALCAASAGDARAARSTPWRSPPAWRAARSGPGAPASIEMDDVVAARDRRIFHQGVSEHYDQVSALIKSVRGSDPDAGLYWLARMIEAGEDPRFLARRLVILASEDVGMADPMALVVADAASRAVEVVGMPEAALNLAECVIYLSHRAQVEPGHRRARPRHGRCPLRHPRRGPQPPARRPLAQRGGATRARRPTATRTTTPRVGSTSSTGPTSWRATFTTSRRPTAPSRRWPGDCGAHPGATAPPIRLCGTPSRPPHARRPSDGKVPTPVRPN